MSYVFLQDSKRGRAVIQGESDIPGVKLVLPYITINSCPLEASFSI